MILVMGVHVDDVIGACMAGPGVKLMNKIKKAFDFGEWHTNKLDYCGKTIEKHSDGTDESSHDAKKAAYPH